MLGQEAAWPWEGEHSGQLGQQISWKECGITIFPQEAEFPDLPDWVPWIPGREDALWSS